MSSYRKPRTKTSKTNNTNGVSSSSAEIVADLDDVLIQILSLLPIKSLLRFKRVSKRWLSLITNPDFSHKLNSSLPISGFFLHEPRAMTYRFVSLDGHDDDDDDDDEKAASLPLRFANHPTKMIIIQSTNGLLLCRCSCPTNQFNTNYYVYNPSTKQNTLLPPNTDLSANHISLAFDPSQSPHYKVFCLTKIDTSSSDLYLIQIYTSNEGQWQVLSCPSFTIPPTINLNYAIFCNGVVYWFGHSRDFLSFDTKHEKITIQTLPNLDQEQEDEPYTGALRFLDESRGYLYSIELNGRSSSEFLVYEMERDGSGWSPKHTVYLEPLAAAFPEMVRTEYYTHNRIYAFYVIGIVREEIDAESYILLHISNKAVRYNFKDKSFKKLCGSKPLSNDDPDIDFYGFQRSFPFIISLANV